MPHQLDNVNINGKVISVLFPFQFNLPPTVDMTKLSDHEVQLAVTYTVKIMFFSITRTSNVIYNLDTGSLKIIA